MKFGEKVVKYRKVILIVSILLLIPSIIGYKTTKINYDMLTYLPSDMETMQGQDMLMDDFGVGGFTIIVVEDTKTNEISEMKDEISQVDHVTSVINFQDVLNPNMPTSMLPDEISSNLNNDNATILAVFFDSTTSDDTTLEAVEEIREIGNEHTYVSGLSALVIDLRNLCEAEEAKYIGVAVLLSIIAMMLLLDSFAAPFLFLISIGMAVLYNMGSNIIFGEISYITKAIAAVLQLGVTLDYSIFLWHSYMEKLDDGLDDHDAMGQAINATLTSVTGSSITTIAGFLALCFMTYTMGRDLGLVMAKGVAFGVICSVTVLPVLLLCFNKLLKRTRHRSLIPDMSKFAQGLVSHYKIFIVVFLILLIPAIYGYNNQNVIYDFSKMLSSSENDIDSDQMQFVEANQKLSDDYGINTSYIVIADSDLASKDAKLMIDEIENEDGVLNVLALDTVLGTSVPREALPDEITSALISDEHQMMIVNSAFKVSTDECNTQLDNVREIVKQYDDTATVIGEAPATQDLIELTSHDFNVVSLISMAMVFVIILFVLKSGILPVILVAAIEFAIFVNLGIPGYTGLELPFIVPVCISTIQLGSTVDYAILMSTRYKEERIGGLGKKDAVAKAAGASIPSIIVSALGFFSATFGVAMYSDIGIISTLCGLMARGAIVSMLTVVFILPSFLVAFDKIICKTTKGMKHIYPHKQDMNTDNVSA